MTTVDTLKKRLDALQPPQERVVLVHVPPEEGDESWNEEEEIFKKQYADAVKRVGKDNITVVCIVDAVFPDREREKEKR